MIAEHDGQSGHPFAANQSDLDFAVALTATTGCKARLGKIDRLDVLVGLLKHLPQLGTITGLERCGASNRSRPSKGRKAICFCCRTSGAPRFSGSTQSLSHRRLRRGASAGDEPYISIRKRNCYARVYGLDRLRAHVLAGKGNVSHTVLGGRAELPAILGWRKNPEMRDCTSLRALNRERFRSPCLSSLQGPRARWSARLCKLPGKSSPSSWSKTGD